MPKIGQDGRPIYDNRTIFVAQSEPIKKARPYVPGVIFAFGGHKSSSISKAG